MIPFEDSTILERTLNESLQVFRPDQIRIVTGAFHTTIKQKLKSKEVKLIYNKAWENGLSSSIKLGLKSVRKIDKMANVMILLADQYKVNADYLESLIFYFQQADPSVKLLVSSYLQTFGPPLIISTEIIVQILNSQTTTGAKKIIYSNLDHLLAYSFPDGKFDLDTERDLDVIEGYYRKPKNHKRGR